MLEQKPLGWSSEGTVAGSARRGGGGCWLVDAAEARSCGFEDDDMDFELFYSEECKMWIAEQEVNCMVFQEEF